MAGFDRFLAVDADAFEAQALWLIMQGYMPEMCEKVLQNLFNMSGYEGKEYLKNVIFAEFVLQIQKGCLAERELKIILTSYLGKISSCFAAQETSGKTETPPPRSQSRSPETSSRTRTAQSGRKGSRAEQTARPSG